MSISIRTLADFRRALAEPGAVLFLDRNDIMADELRRDPTRMAAMSAPRVVKAVRKADFIFVMPDGKDSYMTLPKAANLTTYGTNVVDVVVPAAYDKPDRILRYRIEEPGTPEAAGPSRLAEAHPPLTNEEVAAKAAAAATASEAAAKVEAARKAAYESAQAMPLPVADPRLAALDAATDVAIREALGRGVSCDDEMTAVVMEATKTEEFAEFARLPDAQASWAPGLDASTVFTSLSAALAHHPRGTWMRVLVTHREDGKPCGETLMSTGRASRAEVVEKGFDRTPERNFAKLRGSEIWRDRQAIEATREREMDAAAMARHGFAAGMELGRLRVGLQDFVSAMVESASEDGSSVKVNLRKRGSTRRYSITERASRVAGLCEAMGQKAAKAA